MSTWYNRLHFAMGYARRWGKPRLFVHRGLWWCTGARHQGIGSTAEEAYNMWTRAVACR